MAFELVWIVVMPLIVISGCAIDRVSCTSVSLSPKGSSKAVGGDTEMGGVIYSNEPAFYWKGFVPATGVNLPQQRTRKWIHSG